MHLGAIHRWEHLGAATHRLYAEIDAHGVRHRSLTREQLARIVDGHRAALKALAVNAVKDGVRAELEPYADVIRAWRGAWSEVTQNQGFDPVHSANTKSQK